VSPIAGGLLVAAPAATGAVAQHLGLGRETVRRWVATARSTREPARDTSAEGAEIKA
jgi:transposase